MLRLTKQGDNFIGLELDLAPERYLHLDLKEDQVTARIIDYPVVKN